MHNVNVILVLIIIALVAICLSARNRIISLEKSDGHRICVTNENVVVNPLDKGWYTEAKRLSLKDQHNGYILYQVHPNSNVFAVFKAQDGTGYMDPHYGETFYIEGGAQ